MTNEDVTPIPMAAHLKALCEESKMDGIEISRVIFDPGLQPMSVEYFDHYQRAVIGALFV